MDPVQEHLLRRWISGVIAREGYSLVRTSRDNPEYDRYGRWSRWYFDKQLHRRLLVETNVDLADLASRCRVCLNNCRSL